jgi:hypothetical protein
MIAYFHIVIFIIYILFIIFMFIHMEEIFFIFDDIIILDL